MAFLLVDVSNYVVFAYGGPDGNSGRDAAISLGIPVGFATLYFYPEGATLPPNRKEIHAPSGTPLYTVNYRYSQMANVLDLLRNEKPIKFSFDDGSLGAYITTSQEPVGEGEK